jgi:hypothetical protein
VREVRIDGLSAIAVIVGVSLTGVMSRWRWRTETMVSVMV